MKEFMLGAATAAHQVEGNNIHSDFWKLENMENTNFTEPSLRSVDHYQRYKEDITLLKEAGLNSYRFSIEWARIEPEKGVIDEQEIQHYRDVLNFCKSNDIIPIVTMHHFSSPAWLIREGGWENEKVIEWFRDYCKLIVEELGDLFTYVCTINEANMGLQIAKKVALFKKAAEGDLQIGLQYASLNKEAETRELLSVFGVEKANTFLAPRSIESDVIVLKAHVSARKAMKEVKQDLKVGLTLSLHDVQFIEGGEELANDSWNLEFRRYLEYIKEDDFFGLQNYTRSVYHDQGLLKNFEDKRKTTQMGYEYYPEALEHVIRKVHDELSIPIIITENGIATSDDKERCEFIETALAGVKRCIDSGIPVLGYLHWSLLDNFEWQKGFAYTFGLVEVNRDTFTRKAKPSLQFVGSKLADFVTDK